MVVAASMAKIPKCKRFPYAIGHTQYEMGRMALDKFVAMLELISI